jgi:pimeloyl-ACP methyl ester carboxylesterase
LTSHTPGADAGYIPPPSLFLALTELPRALFELGSLPFVSMGLAQAPRGDGHPVLVLPGFMTSDRSTGILRGYLEDLGYDARPWELGRNLGPKAIGWEGERLEARIKEVFEETGRKVSLVGWSLGGVMARQMGCVLPDHVRQVITLGSPLKGDPRSTNAWGLYKRMTGQTLDDANLKEYISNGDTPPPVPMTAIYSRGDGVVAWQNCCEVSGPETDNIEVVGSHCGLGVNPTVLFAVADRLAQAEGKWAPFERTGMRHLFYPSSGHVH